MRNSEILDKAADLIERGWCRGSYGSPSGKVCSMGAIQTVVNGHANLCMPLETNKPARFLQNVIGTVSIISWNDDPSRQKSQVIAAFRKAAQMARDEEGSANPPTLETPIAPVAVKPKVRELEPA